MLHYNNAPRRTGLLSLLIGGYIFILGGCAQLPQSTEDSAPGQGTAKQQAPPPKSNQTTNNSASTTTQPTSPVTLPAETTRSTQFVKNHTLVDGANLNATNQDLWHWLKHRFTWKHANNDRIARQQKWFAQNTAYVKRVLERSRPYLHYIANQLEKNHLPFELALLPVIESAYRPFAYSHGRATGIWQFIPSTGKSFGLTQDWWYDGRRDIAASTNAAIRFFKQLEREFDGNWLHALAAYNAGPTKVRNAIKHNQKKNLPASYWDLHLPRETRNYVPKLLALISVIDQSEKYKLDLPLISTQPYFAKIDTGKQIDLSRAAKMAGISIEQLYLLNPGFNRWATAPDGPHHLLIPINNAEQFKLALAKLPDAERITWTRHTIKSGETLSTIARRYKTTVGYIKKVNHLSSNLIRAGRALTIPGPGAAESTYAYSASQRLKVAQSNGSGTRYTHKVRNGDTLWRLAKTYGATIRKIAQWNNITPKTPLKLGQKLVIWKKPASNIMVNTQAGAVFQPSIQTIRYTVKSGDSLDGIAHRFNIKVADLLRWNVELKNARYIHPGQKIRLQLDVREQSG